MAMLDESKEAVMATPAVTGINPAAGLPSNDPDAQARMREAMKMRGMDYARAGIMGAAAGGQAGAQTMNPLAAFVQGMAAGLQAPAQIYAQKREQIQSVVDATPFGQTHPEVVKDPRYSVLAGLPTKIALNVIGAIAQDTAKITAEHKAKSQELAQVQGYKETEVDAPMEVTEKAPGDMATRFGVPPVRKNPYYNLPKDVAEKVKTSNMAKAANEIVSYGDKAASIESNINDLQRAKSLIEGGLNTGPIVEALRAERFYSPEAQEFKSLSDKTVPSMRQGLPGAASDRDVEMFKSATFGLGKDEGVNLKIINQGLAVANRIKDHAEFMANWGTVYGDLSGAQAEWNKYAREYPLFDAKGNVIPQVPYQSYFSGANAVKPQEAQKPVEVTPTEKEYFDALIRGGH